MIPLLIPALGGGAVVLAANLTPEEATHREPVAVPLEGVAPQVWVAFVRHFVSPNVVTKHFRYGVFGMTVRRLVDLGVMKNPRSLRQKGGPQKGGPSIVWVAKWVPPLNLEGFLRDTMGQYRLFAESIRRFANEAPVKECVGREVDGQSVTLSGALAVAHRGGLPGFDAWFRESKQRSQFKWTTQAFERCNGLF